MCAVVMRSFYLLGLSLWPFKQFKIFKAIYNDAEQPLELYIPKPNNPHFTKHKPLVVFVHGGAWTFGLGSRRDFYSHCLQLVSKGFPVATVGYRLAPKNRYPSGYNDVQEAIYWLSKNASSYIWPGSKPQTTEITLIGHSAGGHLVLLAALKDKELPVSHVVSFAGPTDLTLLSACKVCDSEKRFFLGGASAEEASPITYARSDAPPISLYHGDSDGVVDLSQSKALYDKLTQVGASVKLKVLKGKGHWFPFVSSYNMAPDRAILEEIVKLASPIRVIKPGTTNRKKPKADSITESC